MHCGNQRQSGLCHGQSPCTSRRLNDWWECNMFIFLPVAHSGFHFIAFINKQTQYTQHHQKPQARHPVIHIQISIRIEIWNSSSNIGEASWKMAKPLSPFTGLGVCLHLSHLLHKHFGKKNANMLSIESIQDENFVMKKYCNSLCLNVLLQWRSINILDLAEVHVNI